MAPEAVVTFALAEILPEELIPESSVMSSTSSGFRLKPATCMLIGLSSRVATGLSERSSAETLKPVSAMSGTDTLQAAEAGAGLLRGAGAEAAAGALPLSGTAAAPAAVP